MLNWDEIQAMAGARIEFGSHTHTHCNMAAESPSKQQVELEASKNLLESRLHRPIRTFAYPYGHAEHMSENSRRSVIAAGYDCAISAEYGLVTSRSDRFRLPRLWRRRTPVDVCRRTALSLRARGGKKHLGEAAGACPGPTCLRPVRFISFTSYAKGSPAVASRTGLST